MGSIARKVAVFSIALLVVCAGILASFAFLCVAVYDGWAAVVSPAAAALLSGACVLFAAFVIAGIVVLVGRIRRRDSSDVFSAGRTIGAIFAKRFREFAEENPRASFLMSFLAGFAAGSGE